MTNITIEHSPEDGDLRHSILEDRRVKARRIASALLKMTGKKEGRPTELWKDRIGAAPMRQ